MGERDIVIDELSITYSGYFSLKTLLKITTDWLISRGYKPQELRNVVQITENGRAIDIEIAPNKKYNDYSRAIINITFVARNLKDKVVSVGDYDEKVNEGSIHIGFAAFLETDYQDTWRTKYPFLTFMRAFFDKYIYQAYHRKYYDQIYKDTMELYDEIKAYLNLNKY